MPTHKQQLTQYAPTWRDHYETAKSHWNSPVGQAVRSGISSGYNAGKKYFAKPSATASRSSASTKSHMKPMNSARTLSTTRSSKKKNKKSGPRASSNAQATSLLLATQSPQRYLLTYNGTASCGVGLQTVELITMYDSTDIANVFLILAFLHR